MIGNLVIKNEKMEFLSSSTLYEYNNIAIFVTTIPRMSPKSNHIAVNDNWFKQHIGK